MLEEREGRCVSGFVNKCVLHVVIYQHQLPLDFGFRNISSPIQPPSPEPCLGFGKTKTSRATPDV